MGIGGRAQSGTDDDDPCVLRARTVTGRMDALGLEVLGPQYSPGRRADPTPEYLPADTRDVPTYHTTGQTPETATNRLDWAIASRAFHRDITVRTLNEVDAWGPSDHCRLQIEVGGDQVVARGPRSETASETDGYPIFGVFQRYVRGDGEGLAGQYDAVGHLGAGEGHRRAQVG